MSYSSGLLADTIFMMPNNMSLNGLGQHHHQHHPHHHHLPVVKMGSMINSTTIPAPNKVPIQPTPGAIRKPPNNKPKQRKSRTGCATCKAKRLKCDETKPFCEQCTRKGIQCGGYAPKLKWKSFEDMQEQKKNAPVRRKSTVIAKMDEDDRNDILELESKRDLPHKSPASSMMPPPPRAASQHNSPYNIKNSPSSWIDTDSPNSFLNGIFNGYTFPSKTPPESGPSPRIDVSSLLCDPNEPGVYTPSQYTPSHYTSASSRTDPSPVESQALKGQQDPDPAELITRTPPPLSGILPLWTEIELHSSDESDNEEINEDLDEDIEEISSDSLIISSSKRRRLSSFVSADSYDLPLYPHEELRLWHFYDKITATILSCKNDANPWRDELIGRAMVSQPLKESLFALTSFHIKRYQPLDAKDKWAMSRSGLDHTNRAFQALYKVMEDRKAVLDENNIAAMLVLSFSQVWDDPRQDGRTHVLGAFKIIQKHLRHIIMQKKQLTPFMRFLYNTWLYLDVISSLSSGEDPYSLIFDVHPSHLSPPPTPSSDFPSPSPTGNFSLQNEIDALIGCAEDLFPLIAKMSRISNRLTHKLITESDLQYISEAICIRDSLLTWQPPSAEGFRESTDEKCSLEDVIRTAEVYRLTALLHLYRSFPPLGKDPVRLADQILNHLLMIPKESGSLCIHIWPLMAAGCEFLDRERRQKVLDRFENVSDYLRVANVDSAIHLLGEVWSRRDNGDMNANWPQLGKEIGWNLLLG